VSKQRKVQSPRALAETDIFTSGVPLRVCFVVESGTDVRLVEGLAARTRLTLVARRVGGREISQPTDAKAEIVVGPSTFPRFALFVCRWICRHPREFDAIVVQGYGPAAFFTNVAARFVGVPAVMLVCSPVETYYDCRRRDPGGRPYRAFEALAIRVLARLNALVGRRYIVLGSYLASVVRAHGGHRPIDIIPVYGIDTTRFTPSTRPRRDIRAQLGLPLDASLVFFSSRIAPEKDPMTLLDAVRMLRDEGRDLRILHLSGGYREFQARARDLGLETAVIAHDAVAPFEGLASWYQAADVCVQASREEGLGFSPLEALACEVPVIASAVGGLLETIVDGETGWTFPVGDPPALAARLRAVIDHPEEGVRRARNGRAMVQRSYESTAAFDAFVERLSSLRTREGDMRTRAIAG
jgi:glycosyltransferase involved in cell wall biosynthesis